MAVHLEAWISSTALWALWWLSRFTVFWYNWWIPNKLPQYRGSRPADTKSRWLAKAWSLPKLKRKVKVMTLEVTTSSIVVYGQEGTVSPSRTERYVSCKGQLICHLSPFAWVILCYFSIKFPCFRQLRQSCYHCWHHWYKVHQNCLMLHSRESMVATWPS